MYDYGDIQGECVKERYSHSIATIRIVQHCAPISAIAELLLADGLIDWQRDDRSIIYESLLTEVSNIHSHIFQQTSDINLHIDVSQLDIVEGASYPASTSFIRSLGVNGKQWRVLAVSRPINVHQHNITLPLKHFRAIWFRKLMSALTSPRFSCEWQLASSVIRRMSLNSTRRHRTRWYVAVRLLYTCCSLRRQDCYRCNHNTLAQIYGLDQSV